MGARQRRRERLGRQVSRHLGVSHPGKEVAQDAVLMAAVESTKGRGLSARCPEQALIRRCVPHRCHHPYFALPPCL